MKTDREFYKKNGYLLLKSFFQKDEIKKIKEDAIKIFKLQLISNGLIKNENVSEKEFEKQLYELFKKNIQAIINCGKQVQHLISLHRLSLDERILGTLNELGIELPNISTRPVMFFNSPHLAKKEVFYKVFPHQDWRSMQSSLDAIVVWIPLMDVPKELGALEIIPGSHKKGLMTLEVEEGFGKVNPEFYKEEDFVSAEVEEGDALFFSSFLVHQSGNNITDSIRWSTHFRYNNLLEKTFIQRGYPHNYVYKPMDELITPGFPTTEDIKKIFS